MKELHFSRMEQFLMQPEWSRTAVRKISNPFAQRTYGPPLSSSGLNPMDFGVWSILKQKVYVVSNSSIKVLKTKLTKSWAEINVELVHAICDQVTPCLCWNIRKERFIE